MSSTATKRSFVLVAYYLLYIAYLFVAVKIENEWTHYLTLVLFPTGILLVLMHHEGLSPRSGLLAVWGFINQERKRLVPGILAAILVGGILGALQIILSRDREIIYQAFSSGKFLYAFPMATGLMLITAGFTEEYFFRGLLQSSLTESFKSKVWAVILSSLAFGLYHLPYAYLLDSWPSHGNFVSAIGEGVIPSFVLGIVFGALYSHFRNLIVSVLAHSIFNAFWAMKLFL